MAKVSLKDLSVEDRARLLADAKKMVQEVIPYSEHPADDKYLFTNASGGTLTLPDLGSQQGETFDPEIFDPGQCKNLAEIYTIEELRKSKTLNRAVKNGLLLNGEVSGEALEKALPPNPFTQLVQNNREGQFEDPTSGRAHYDLKLQKLEQQAHEDDLSTQKGYQSRATA